jgi:hypothetical protein
MQVFIVHYHIYNHDNKEGESISDISDVFSLEEDAYRNAMLFNLRYLNDIIEDNEEYTYIYNFLNNNEIIYKHRYDFLIDNFKFLYKIDNELSSNILFYYVTKKEVK